MDNTKFGKFIAELRKEKNMTQKQLAEKLNLTDKAISKWERGLSFPDITILNPLADVLEINISELLNCEKGNKKEIDINKAVEEAIEKINRTKEKREKKIIKIKKIIGIISIIIFILAVALQSIYIFKLKKRGFEYVIDSLFYIVNQLIIVCLFLVAYVYIKKKSKIKNIIIYSTLLVLTIINLAFTINNGLKNKCIISFSSDFSNQLVLKQNKETGETVFYRNAILLFAKPNITFSYPSVGKIKKQWLTTDICSVTYKDLEGNLHEFVATYGDRGNGISYSYVKNAILGEWGKNDIYMIVDNKGITINCNGEKDRFENSDIQQFGTIAIVLYKKEEPRYVIALNKNCELDEATYIIKKDGTITLAKISMDKTVAYELNCMTYKGNLQNYKIVDMDPYSYRIKNGTLYVKYNEDRVVEAPEDFSNNGYTFNKYNYQISNEKTVFPYRQNGKTYLIYSDNKGITWNKVEIDGNSTIENIHFINSQIGFMLQFEDMAMTVAFGHISKTVDGGKTWQIINKGIGEEKIFRKESQIRFFSENLGFVTMTYSGEKCDLYITTDGGQNFKKIELTPSNWNEEMQWKEIYDYYNLPELKSGRLTIEVGQGTDGDYNGGNTVKFYSDDNGISWKEEVV